MWRRQGDLKPAYDVVIVGGGSHGLAAAYYLQKDHGIRSVAVLEKRYIGSGAAGRNTTILRSNYKTPEGAKFYDASVKLYEGLARELNFNLLFSQCGHLTLAHSDRAMFVMANRAEVNRLNGIDSRLIGPEEVKRLAPAMYVGPDTTYPILGALYHPPGGVTYGFKAAPIVGKTLAELVDTGRTPDLIAPFTLERFYTDRLVSELAAAAVSH